jgi:hypothetical protein
MYGLSNYERFRNIMTAFLRLPFAAIKLQYKQIWKY